MYTLRDYEDINRQLRKNWLCSLLPFIVLLGVVVWSFIVRIRWLTMAATILAGAILIFTYGIYIAPLSRYRRHLELALSGTQKVTEGIFKFMEEKPVEREGVMYFPFIINVGDQDEEDDDRLFYYDANLKRPAWQAGQVLRIQSYEKFVSGWEAA